MDFFAPRNSFREIKRAPSRNSTFDLSLSFFLLALWSILYRDSTGKVSHRAGTIAYREGEGKVLEGNAISFGLGLPRFRFVYGTFSVNI